MSLRFALSSLGAEQCERCVGKRRVADARHCSRYRYPELINRRLRRRRRLFNFPFDEILISIIFGLFVCDVSVCLFVFCRSHFQPNFGQHDL